jgi:hypothetical protein
MDGRTGTGTAESQEADPADFEEYRTMDVEVTSNVRDGATVDVNGTQLKIFQAEEYLPMMAEIYVEAETNPLATINIARGETVTLGGVDERLADRVEEIAEMPVEEIPAELERLAYRINPSGRDPPSEATNTEGGADE